MSFQTVDTFKAHSKSKGATRLVGMMLAHYTNEEGYAWPSIDLLQADTNASERTIRQALRELAALNEYQATIYKGKRAYKLTIECPTECDGDYRHGRNLSDYRNARRNYENAKKRRQRTTNQTLETVKLEMSRQNLPGQEASRTPLRNNVPAKSTSMSRQNLPGQNPLYIYIKKRKRKETSSTSETSKPQLAASRKPTPQRLETKQNNVPLRAAKAAGGGNIEILLNEVRSILPKELCLQVPTSRLKEHLQVASERGMTNEQIKQAMMRSWTNAGPGAVIAFVKQLEPPPQALKPATEPIWCRAHPKVDIRQLQCAKCETDRRASLKNSGFNRLPGETTQEWLKRIAKQNIVALTIT